MRPIRQLLIIWLALIAALPQAPVLAGVVVEMPPPPKADRQIVRDEPDAGEEAAAASATLGVSESVTVASAAPAAQSSASPSVGQIALARYSRARQRPFNTYYIGSRRFAGYMWPSNYWGWGPSYYGYGYGWSGFWPGWSSWGRCNVTVNCDNGGGNGSSE